MSALFTEPVLVVAQKRELFGTSANYMIHHPQGAPLAQVSEEASTAKKVFRFFSTMDDKIARTLHVGDAQTGAHLLTIRKDFGFAMPSTDVYGPDGQPVGQIAKEMSFMKPKFTLKAPGGQPAGMITGNFFAREFAVVDTNNVELARISKRFNGLAELFTEADSYVMQMIQNVQGPFRSLIVATCIAVDIVVHENRNR